MDSNRELACPQCDTPFEQREVQGVVVDFCLTCGGVWLDPGELQELTGYKRHATHSTHDDLDEHEDDEYRFDVEDDEVEESQHDSDGGGLLGFVADAIDGAGDGDDGGGGGWGGGGDGGGGGGE